MFTEKIFGNNQGKKIDEKLLVEKDADFVFEQSPELANSAYEALGFKGKDFIYTSELIDEIIKNPDFEPLLPVAQIFKQKDAINKTKVYLRLVNKTNNTFGQTTSFIENNKIAGNVSIYDKQYYETIKDTILSKHISQQETLLHEEIHRYTYFIIREYNKIAKFPGIEYYKEFEKYFDSFGLDVSKETEFLKEYDCLVEIYQSSGGKIDKFEFITFGLTNKTEIEFLKSIVIKKNDVPERIKTLFGNTKNNVTLYDALLDSFKNYYTNLSDNTYATSTDTLKLKFDNVLVSPEQKQQAEKIYAEYVKTLSNKETITKEGFINFIKIKNLKDS